MLAKWIKRLCWVALFVVVALILFPAEFFAVAWVGEKTGWYRVEDYMCTIPEGCEEYIAERKRQREIRTTPKSN